MFCFALLQLLLLPPFKSPIIAKVVHHTQLFNQHFEGTLKYINPMAYLTDVSDNVTYTIREMLQQPVKNEFI